MTAVRHCPFAKRAERLARFAGVWVRQHTEGEGRFVSVLEAFFNDQAAEVAAELRQQGQGATAATLLTPEQDARLLGLVAAGLDGLALTGATTELRLHGPGKGATLDTKATDDPFEALRLKLPPSVADAIAAFVDTTMKQPHWSTIGDTARDGVGAALKESLDKGENLDQQAKRVQVALEGTSKARAERIARTETTASLNAGHEAARQHLAALGLLEGVEWLAVIDNDTRDSHREANGQRVGVGGEFVVGGHKCAYPGDQRLPPSERVHCRCAAVSVVRDDLGGGE